MWHPNDETTAASNRSAFIEWLRAIGARPGACPKDLDTWEATDPGGYHAATLEFAGIRPARGVRESLLRWRGPREALVLGPSPGRRWSRDALRADPPERIKTLISRIPRAAFGRLASQHLFQANIRPCDRILWRGDPDDPWPLGVWIVGATLLLPDTLGEPFAAGTPAGPTIVLTDRTAAGQEII